MSRPGGRAAVIGIATSLALCALIAACSPATAPGDIASASIEAPATGSPGSTAEAPPSIPASPVSGVLLGIDAASLSEVTGFTLRLDDGRSFEFLIGTLENGVEFPPGHLAEHLATSTPIRVSFRVDGTSLVAYRLEDAE